MSDEQVKPLPCPKCGCEVTTMKYDYKPMPNRNAPGLPHIDWYCTGRPPHFDRQCTRCSYKWQTMDVLGAEDQK